MTLKDQQTLIDSLRDAAMIIDACALWADKPATAARLRDRAQYYRDLLGKIDDTAPNTSIL